MAGGESVLCEAARNRNLEQVFTKDIIQSTKVDSNHLMFQVKQLIDSGDNVNQIDKHGETPLIIASCLGYTEVQIITK